MKTKDDFALWENKPKQSRFRKKAGGSHLNFLATLQVIRATCATYADGKQFNHEELFLTLLFGIPLADAPPDDSRLATYVVQGFFGQFELILGGRMVVARHF